MPLIKCIDCGHDVSDRANACPNCGCPIGFSLNKASEQDNTIVPNVTVSNNILDELIRVISLHPGYTAKDYFKIVDKSKFPNVDKRTINHILYKEVQFFNANLDEYRRPHWKVDEKILKASEISKLETLNRIKQYEYQPMLHDGFEWPKALNLYPWQKQALNAWQDHNYIGAIHAVTGAGKTRLALAAIDVHIKKGFKVAIIVPNKELQRQWYKRIMDDLVVSMERSIKIGLLGNGYHNSLIHFDVVVAIVNSACKEDLLPLSAKGLLVADECHSYGATEWSKVLQSRFERRMGLSATFEREDNGNEDFLEPYFKNIVYDLGYEKALEEQVINNFRVSLFGIDLDEEEQAEYEEYERICRKNKQKLVSMYNIQAEPFGEFIKSVVILAEKGVREAQSYLNAFSKKRAFVSESPSKLIGIIKTVELVKSRKKTIVFTQTIESANRVARIYNRLGIKSAAITGDLSDEERKDILEKFTSGYYKVISGAKLLDVGIDIPDVDQAIVIGSSSTERQMRQRMGRILRISKDKMLSELIVLYAKNTFEDPVNGFQESFLDNVEDAATDTFFMELDVNSINLKTHELINRLNNDYENYTYVDDDVDAESIEEALELFISVRALLDNCNKSYCCRD